MHHYNQLIDIFDRLFYQSENTKLIRGDGEPIYLPVSDGFDYSRIVFANGFFASALHEVSHWCIAGEKRRHLEDYGYWYAPDGRNAAQQAEFEKVEIKPQAVEWAFCAASGFGFNVSCDNLSGIEIDRLKFQNSVSEQVDLFLETGFPKRAQQFINALAECFDISLPLTKAHFDCVLPQKKGEQ